MKILCPICKQELIAEGKQAKCRNHHSFDYAKSGYLNLYISNRKDHGDNKEMIQARTSFLSSGAYEFLRYKLVEIIRKYSPSVFVDLACGEGYYTQKIPAKEKYGIDLSKDALIHASKQDLSTSYLLSSIFGLPFEDQCADAVLTCFAPFAKDEVERILKPDGIFVFVTPGKEHLFQMKQVLYQNPYYNQHKDLDTSLTLIHEEMISEKSILTNSQLHDLFRMTPYAYKTGIGGLEKLEHAGDIEMTKEFVIRVYQKQEP